MKLGPFLGQFRCKLWYLTKFPILYASNVYWRVYQLFPCILCLRTLVFCLISVFSHFWPQICCHERVYHCINIVNIIYTANFAAFEHLSTDFQLFVVSPEPFSGQRTRDNNELQSNNSSTTQFEHERPTKKI